MTTALFILCGLAVAYPIGRLGDAAMAFLRKTA